MSGITLVSGPVAGQSPYVYSDEASEQYRRAAQAHYREVVIGAEDVCGECKLPWEADGCPSFRQALTFDRVKNVEIEWKSVAPAELPEVVFDVGSDATQVLYIDPAVFDEPRKPSPFPRELAEMAA